MTEYRKHMRVAHVTTAKIAWVNVQLFWYQGYGPVALAAAAAYVLTKVL